MPSLENFLKDQQSLVSNTEKKSGFFDLEPKQYCNSPEHKPPMHINIPPGKGYRHICPKCGKVTDIIPQQISF